MITIKKKKNNSINNNNNNNNIINNTVNARARSRRQPDHDHEDEPDDRVGPVPGRGGRRHGHDGPRVRRPGPAAVHTGHAAAADAVVPGGRAGRPVGRPRVGPAARRPQQATADGHQRAGTGRQTVQVHVRHGPRGGVRRAAATG